ncbi:MAG: hypothetical protein QXM54_01430 [Desulfurococcaceae archaeon]
MVFNLAIVVDRERFKPTKFLILVFFLTLSLIVALLTPKITVKMIHPVELGLGDLIVNYEATNGGFVINITNKYSGRVCITSISCRNRVLVLLNNTCIDRNEYLVLNLNNTVDCPYLNIRYTIGNRNLSKIVFIRNLVMSKFDLEESIEMNETNTTS